LLDSKDGQATLIVVELNNEFLDQRNRPTIDRLEKLVDPLHGDLKDKVPAGLHLALSGSATVGRDMLVAAEESASATQTWTVVLVIALLIAIYRAPFVAIIPLVSVFISLEISMGVLVLLTWAGQHGVEPFHHLKPFSGLRTYLSVIVYGAGVDYCLFLIARYKEEYDRGLSVDEALTKTLDKVGPSVLASAGTVACGIGMMVFALFGKFQQAGITMAFALLLMLICALTLTPALIRFAGKYAFWPEVRSAATPVKPAQPVARWWHRWIPANPAERVWNCIANAITCKPGIIWITAMLMMLPFAITGVIFHNQLSYGLLSELPPQTTSVVGAKAVQGHFSAGETGPITVLIQNPKLDFSDADTFDAVETLEQRLVEHQKELGVSDVRSAIHPLGLHNSVGILARGVAKKRYISEADGYDTHVVRMDLVLSEDPFSRGSMQQVQFVQRRIQELLPEAMQAGTSLYFLGTTPSLLDLKTVTDRDQIVIDGSVMAVVLLILVALLRMFSISLYLVLSVFFSYFVSLGMTIAIFHMVDPQFDGVDWKVPIFLFTILVAVGEDYNIFLMARIQEDQHEQGPIKGIRTAMLSTGSIISSCGIIMAGTFFSLVLAGHLRGAQQLGTALTLGVLLDTFIVRPILVPAWLMMLNRGYFGVIPGYLLGATIEPSDAVHAPLSAPPNITKQLNV
jgi:RND superfamily putative drug exporter